MIYTPAEYSKKFLFRNKKVSPMTVKRRCRYGMLPAGHIAIKKSFGWVINVIENELVKT
jgi:hypothetical protein